MARTVAIGKQDFASIMENHYFFVDKTEFIREWWELAVVSVESEAEVLLSAATSLLEL